MSDDVTQDDGITEMMWDALRLLATSRHALVRRHGDIADGTIPVRTASALEKRGLVERVPTGDKTTSIRLTVEGAGAIGVSIDDLDRLPVLTEQQVEHIHRTIRYLGEALQALEWAELPSPEGAYQAGVTEWKLALRDGQRMVADASNHLIEGLETYANTQGSAT